MSSDPLFVGLTRPAMLAGVTYSGLVLNAMVVAVPFIMFNRFIYLLLAVPLHAVMWLICRWDPRFFDLAMTWAQTTARTRFRHVWGGATYRQ